MSKLDQIQNALKSISDPKYQKLGDSYLIRTLDVKEIEPRGSVTGKEKTSKGTPDTLIKLNNGKYVFVEYTTQESGLLRKFSNDLKSCFDIKKTGISLSEVEKIILACNSDLTRADKIKLIKKGQAKGCAVEFIELTDFSFKLEQKFQTLAKNFLDVELDTGQILKPIDFVEEYQKSKFATPLDNKFYFRETEKEQILEASKGHDLIVLSGKAGVGKSKLALECVKQFVESNPNFQPFCITNKNLDLYENLKTYFGADGNYLIVVDDANRLSQLSHILRLLHEQTATRRVKIILTVRDYAVNQINNETKNYTPTQIELNRFSDDEISKILEDDFNIKNHDYLYRIRRIAQGNPRLAIMAAKIALETNRLDSINDVSGLYDEYFSSISEDLKELGNENLIKVAGIISFFKALDRTNTETFEIVGSSFDLSANDLWTNLEKLHELEIVDLDYEVAKVSDQILGTYLFYKAFFKDEAADFSVLLKNFFDKFSYRMVDSLNPVLRDFDNESVSRKMQPYVDKRWEEIKDNEDKLLNFIKVFYYLKRTEALLYIKRQIESFEKIEVNESELKFVPQSYQPLTDKYLEVLRLFQGDSIEAALSLIFDYLEKNLHLLPQVTHLLTDDFCFDHNSHLWGYYVQRIVISKLVEKSNVENSDLYEKILLQVSGKYLQMRFQSTYSENAAVVTIHNILLIPCEEIYEIRKKLWDKLIEIYQNGKYQSEVFKIIESYSQTWGKDSIVKEIVEKDAEILIPFVASLDTENYQVCVLANKYLHFLEKVEVDFDKSLISKFNNKTYEISKILLSDDRWQLTLEYEEYEKYKKGLLESYFCSYQFEDYKELFERCVEIQSYQKEERDFYQLHYPLARVLVNLADTNKELFLDTVNHLLESGNKLYLAAQHIIYKFIEKSVTPKDAYQRIKQADFNAKTNWLFGFFQSLAAKSTNQYFLGELYELYRNANLREVPQSFEYLSNYLHIDRNVYVNVIKTVFERVENEEGYFNFHYLFNSYGDTFKELEDIFVEDVQLLKEIYLYQVKIERHPDHEGKAFRKIFQLDGSFLFEYLESLYEKESSFDVFHDGNKDFSFVWEQDNYNELFRSLLNFSYEKEHGEKYFYGASYIELFLRNLNDEKEKAINLLKEVFQENAKDKNKASYTFQIVVNCFGDRKKEFLEIFLQENKNLEDFRWLSFDTNHVVMADRGSFVFGYENKVKFYESILPLFNTIDLLEHKLAIEEEIKYCKQSIEREKKRDFIGHF